MKKMWLVVLLAGAFTLLLVPSVFPQWQPDLRLTWDPAESYTSNTNARNVAASGDTVHVVWWDRRQGSYDIYYKRSLDNGATWGLDDSLTNNPYDQRYPSIAVSGSNVHVVWEDSRDGSVLGDEIYYKSSATNGTSWGSDTRLTYEHHGSEYPSVAVSGSNVHVVWDDFRDSTSQGSEIYYKRFYGSKWLPDVRLTFNDSSSNMASVAASGSYVHVVWQDTRVGPTKVYYKRSANSGGNWSADTLLSNFGSFRSVNPCVYASGSVVHVVWLDSRGGSNQIFYKRSIDNGATWGPDTPLANGGLAGYEYPSVSSFGSVVEVVWDKDAGGTIYSKRSTDNGTTWSPVTQVTFGVTWVGCAQTAAVTASTTHLVFNRLLGGSNYEVYYKRRLGSGGYDGFMTEPSQGRHLVRDPARNVLHLVMKSEQTDSVYYLRSTDSGVSWSAPLLLGYGKYPTVGLAQLPQGVYPPWYALCVAFRGNQAPGTNLALFRFIWNDNYSDPGSGNIIHWHSDSLVASVTDAGAPSLVTNGTQIFVAYPTMPTSNPSRIYCDNFYYSTPNNNVREIINSGAQDSLDQPCLAVDGNGEIYAAWKRHDQIRYSRRNGGAWNDTLRVDPPGSNPSQQPFVECYGESVFVAYSDWIPGPGSFDIRRAAKRQPDIQWQRTNISNSSNSSESPTQAWREFTTWSEGTGGGKSDVKYWSPGFDTGTVLSNPSTWSYWTHSQMAYPNPGAGTYLWSAWTEGDSAYKPPYTVLTKCTFFPFLGGGDAGAYYSASAGDSVPSPYLKSRDGVMQFGGNAVDFARDSLVYELPYLDPQYDYYLKVSSYREAGSNWAQSLSVNDSLVRSVQFRINQVDTAWIKIPPKAYQSDRKVVFALRKVSGNYVTSLGLTLYQRDPLRGKGGPQSAGLADSPLRDVFEVSPNPTKGEVQVEYSLRTPDRVDLSVYDVVGRLVKRVVNDRQPAGVYKVAWDGRDQAGRLSGSGVYFLRLSTPERVRTKRLVVVR